MSQAARGMHSRTRTIERRSQIERSATTRQQLIQSAADCIADRGLVSASLEVIADQAGVTRGAVQHHFGTRNDLLLAVVDQFGRELSRSLGDRIPADVAITDRVERICHRYWTLFSGRHFLAVMQIWLGMQSDSGTYRQLLNRVHWFEVELDRQWAEIFADSPLAPAQIAAARHIVLATMRGLALRMSYTKDSSRSSVEIALLQRMLVAVLTDTTALK
jgi:AcrR family transcriptional regulator